MDLYGGAIERRLLDAPRFAFKAFVPRGGFPMFNKVLPDVLGAIVLGGRADGVGRNPMCGRIP